MKALLVLLSATAALASHSNPSYGYPEPSFPVTSLVFTIIFGIVMLLNVLWIVKVAKTKPNTHAADLEKQSLVNSTLPEGVVATNINVSAKSRSSLLAELRHDEHLVWAHETVAPMRVGMLVLLSISLCIAAAGFATALAFTIVLDGDIDIVLLSMWMPFIFTNGMLYMIAGILQKVYANSVIFALTSKRVFIFSSSGGGCCNGRVETVRAYDLDGIHQTTLTRKDDGSGTLTFSAAAIVQGGYHGHHNHYGLFAFTNIPNVTAVKDMIEQYKTIRKKQAANQ
jgi:hypothetical protein